MERPASGAATLPTPQSFPNPPAISFAERASALLWEDWLRHAPQTQQAEMLELAQRQGFLFVHQLPRPADGGAAPPTPAETDRVALLQRLLGGATGGLAPTADLDGSLGELTLPPLERLAVWRGWRTPDIALFRARPGSAATVLAEIAVQAARHGQRVLLAAQSTAPIDATLAKLQCPSPVLPVRLLGPGESAAALAPAIRALTLDEQRQAFQAKTMQQAEQALTAAEDCCRRRQAEEPLWPELRRVAVAHAELDGRLRALQERRTSVPGEVNVEANDAGATEAAEGGQRSNPAAFCLELARQLQAHVDQANELARAQARLSEEQADGCVALAEAETAWAALEPLSAARNAGRWWTPAWWRARFTADLPERVRELDARRRTLRAEQERRAAELATLAGKREELEARFAARRQALIDAEVERRRAEWDAQIEVLQAQLEPLRRQWSDLVARFRPTALAPQAVEPAAVQAAQARWQEHRQQDEAAGLFARQWATFLHEAAPRFLKQLPRYASLVAGTHAALRGNAEALEGGFDLVIVEEADRLLESDLLRLARKGQRWLLVGELPAAGGSPGGGSAPAARPSTFAKFWQALHVRPNPQPYVFRREGERLCCQLRPVSSRDRQHIESERLADFPEIELRILSLPRSKPQLVQVVFPPGMTLAQAKAFVYRELQEVALHAKGRNLWLEETASVWRVHLDPAGTPAACADLDGGLCEHLASDGATCRVDFAKTHWQRGQVDEWIERHLRCRELGRTVDLT